MAVVASPPMPRLRPRVLGLLGVLVAACGDVNAGIPPEADRLFFPSGLRLDPRTPPGEAARYLFVVNGNNDLAFNGGTVVAVDLDAFFASWTANPDTMIVDPYCNEDAVEITSGTGDDDPVRVRRCVQNVGSGTSAELPCRRLSRLPQVVECDESPFLLAAQAGPQGLVSIGNFGTLLTSDCADAPASAPPAAPRPCETSRLWVPVRGDPSLTYFDIGGDHRRPPKFECGQDPDSDDPRRCANEHRLTHLRNDEELTEISREPFNFLVWPGRTPQDPAARDRLAFVAHADTPALSVVSLGGLDFADEQAVADRPSIVDNAAVFDDNTGIFGGFGLAVRPCDPARAPALTQGCTRPLVYATMRYSPRLKAFTAQGIDLDAEGDSGGSEDPHECASPDDVDQAEHIICDPRVRSIRTILTGNLDPLSAGVRPILGDLAFADDAGDELLVVQTTPGALLKLDTSIGSDGEPVDTPSSPPLELCDEPTRMRLYRAEGQRFALISCFRAAKIYVVDLDAFRVIGAIVTGTGPYDLEVDTIRRVLYVSNNLEGSISIIDLAFDRPTRFHELARIGLQEPFSR